MIEKLPGKRRFEKAVGQKLEPKINKPRVKKRPVISDDALETIYIDEKEFEEGLRKGRETKLLPRSQGPLPSIVKVGKGRAINNISHPSKVTTKDKKSKVSSSLSKSKKAVKKLPKPKHDYLCAKEVLTEIQKNKDCFVTNFSDTCTVFVKKIEVSTTKINENSVFQPHEKTGKSTYCIVVIFEFNHIMEELHYRRYAMHDRSHQYKSFIERGANVYTIYEIGEIEELIKGIE
jgi:hypothetical protein